MFRECFDIDHQEFIVAPIYIVSMTNSVIYFRLREFCHENTSIQVEFCHSLFCMGTTATQLRNLDVMDIIEPWSIKDQVVELTTRRGGHTINDSSRKAMLRIVWHM